MDALPEFEKLSDAELERLIAELTEQEAAISLKRRTLHGEIAILLAEGAARAKGGSLKPVRLEDLVAILLRGRPPGWLASEQLAFRLAL